MNTVKENLHSLFLSAWYPNRDDAMSGLFVRKHADAVSAFCRVTVLYLHADEKIKTTEVVIQEYNQVKEVLVYYPSGKGLSGKIKKQINYLKAWHIGLAEVFTRFGQPSIVHVNILTRTGIPALFLKINKKIPYVVTEHWSRYLVSRNSYHGLIRKIVTRLVVSQASAVLPITANLQEAMHLHGLENAHYQVINNVVEDFFFQRVKKTNTVDLRKHIVHISCFDDEPKNISGILRVTEVLSNERDDFKLTIAGTGKDEQKIKSLAEKLNISADRLHFTGELTPNQIAILLQQADFFLLFSNNENAPVVISESLACGKPVVSTNVGGISEMIDSSNGILIPPGNENALKNTLNYMLDHFQEYDADSISTAANLKYSYQQVGKQIYQLYKQILS